MVQGLISKNNQTKLKILPLIDSIAMVTYKQA